MKTTILAAAALVALIGCGGSECEDTDSLAMVGEAPPPHADLVLAVAQERCGRPIVGTIAWANGVLEDGTGGRCSRDHVCPISAIVARLGPEDHPWPAYYTDEAHEVGHWCLDSSDEGLVQSWADSVNDEAKARCLADAASPSDCVPDIHVEPR